MSKKSGKEIPQARFSAPGASPAVSVLGRGIKRKRGARVCRAAKSVFITKRKYLKTLEEAELRYETLVNSGEALIWTSGPDKKCDFFNVPWLNFTGKTLEQELGDGWLAGIHPDDQARCRETYSGAFVRHERFRLEYRLRRSDGSFRWIQDDGRPRFDVRGKFLGYISHCQDISDRKQAEEKTLALMTELRKEKTSLSTLIDSITDEVWFADPQGRFTLANPAALKEFDLEADQAIKVAELAKNLEVFRPDGSPRPLEEAPPLLALQGSVIRNQEEIVRTPVNSELRYRQVSASPVRDSDGNIVGSVSVVRDVTDLHRAEASLQNSESRYRRLVENAQEAILVAQDGFLRFVNQAAVEITGYSEQDLLSRPFPEFIHPDDQRMVVDRYLRRLAGETNTPRYAFRLLTPAGEVKWMEIGAVLIEWENRPATLNFLTDITDRHKAEEILQASLREKEVMLREIHHRVKNNMQIISSLLNLQAENVSDENSRRFLKEGQLRIRSIAAVHDKLYKSQDLSRVAFAEYVQNLADHLFHFFQVKPGRIRLEADLEPVQLDIYSAVPCGLLFNELISNALKHAFPEEREGVVETRLRRNQDGNVEIRVADNGVGLSDAVNIERAESIGLQIVTLLVGQLEGTIDINRERGTAITIVFREPEVK